jgi:HAE1 family hydrophobic/amphiphilic exporter-1
MLVYIVMAAQFESYSDPFIIMFSVPFGVSGVFIALWLSHTTLNLMSILGIVLLLGIVVKNGIVLIDYTRLCRERGQGVIKAVVTAGRSRLRPILMTTLTTILGMVPLALGRGEGSEIWRPLGISVIGGLTLSTLLTLVLIPVVYCTFAGSQIKRARKKHARQLALDAYWQEHKQTIIKDKKI